MPIREINGLDIYMSELLCKREIIHGFTGRKGGVSKGEYESLSMSPRRGDDPSSVRKNEKILCEKMGLTYSRLTSTRQEHTDEIAVIDEENVGIGINSPWDKGVDAIITLLPDTPLLAYAADCVPILMYAPSIGAIAAIHSGWKGTWMQIARKAAEKIISMGAESRDIIAVIGPAIGQCCYEVSSEVALLFPKECRIAKENDKYMLDLKKANEMMLRELGVEKIDISSPCTKCRNDIFFSHRGQGGKSGTLGAVIERRE